MRIFMWFLVVSFLANGPAASLDATTKCKPVHNVGWQFEKDEYEPAGFKEEPVEDYEIKVAIDKKVLAISENNSPEIWRQQALRFDPPNILHEKGYLWNVRYARSEEEVHFFEKLIFEDPMCKRANKSTLTYVFVANDGWQNVRWECECLDDYDLEHFVD